MKIERLVGILSVLLQQDKVTAPYLAEKFEVSRRTINRDIEDICAAGIPLVTTQGRGGGISIMEGYRIDRTVLTSSEMESVLAGLRSLDSVSGTNKVKQLMDKFYVEGSDVLASNNHILIDLSSWYKSSLTPKIELIQSAISDCDKISFDYFSPSGESKRVIEPYKLVFKWSSWYVWGYCCKRRDYRTFKLNRIIGLCNTGEKFEKRQACLPELSGEKIYPSTLNVRVAVDSSVKWRLVDEFGCDSFTVYEDGRLLLSAGFTDKESLFGWILTFGDKAELIEPYELRAELYSFVQKIGEKYEGER